MQVGDVIDRVTFTAEQGKVREFVAASRAEDPVHLDEQVARERGLPAPATTPTYSVVAGHYRDQSAFVERLGLDRSRVVVGEVSWAYHRPMLVGDVVSGERRLTADDTKTSRRGGTMRVLTFVTTYSGKNGDPIVTVEETIIEREAS